MNFAAQIYVDAYGCVYGASETDQAYTTAAERTVKGVPVVYAGKWFGSQMSYRPFRQAIKNAQKEAALKRA